MHIIYWTTTSNVCVIAGSGSCGGDSSGYSRTSRGKARNNNRARIARITIVSVTKVTLFIVTG